MSDPAVAVPVAEIAAALLAELEIGPRARIVAQSIVDALGDVAVAVFVVEGAEASLWTVKATAGDIAVDGAPIPVDSELWAPQLGSGRFCNFLRTIFRGKSIRISTCGRA